MQTRVAPPIADWPTPTAQRPIWTGHQLTLFHPGIVAKYLAAEAASPPTAGAFGNVVVDQDVYDPLSIVLPRREGDRLSTQRFSLGRTIAGVSPGCQPPVEGDEIALAIEALPEEMGVDRVRWLDAFSASDAQAGTLAEQMDVVLRRLLPESYGRGASVFASALLKDESELLDRLLHDAPRCARQYNDAVRSFPGAGIGPMSVELDRVEVPLWELRWLKPRRRVYVDIADTLPMFITEDGEPIADLSRLAPRALLMTAMLRRPDRCALFIHGTGGWNYDRITEQWWQAWQDQTLAPMALATADVLLDFDDVPHGPPEVLRQAVWDAHHLPHNLDRVLKLDSATAAKRELLEHMHDDRDKKRRRAAFKLIHQLNAELAEQHPEAIAAAQHALEQARIGVGNADVAGKRDWPFLLYPAEKIEALRVEIGRPLEKNRSPLAGG